MREAIDTIERFKDLDPTRQNEQLKTIIKKIRYRRAMPDEVKALPTRNPIRRNYPFEIKIEYINLR